MAPMKPMSFASFRVNAMVGIFRGGVGYSPVAKRAMTTLASVDHRLDASNSKADHRASPIFSQSPDELARRSAFYNVSRSSIGQ
jgi:hypothetical protein